MPTAIKVLGHNLLRNQSKIYTKNNKITIPKVKTSIYIFVERGCEILDIGPVLIQPIPQADMALIMSFIYTFYILFSSSILIG